MPTRSDVIRGGLALAVLWPAAAFAQPPDLAVGQDWSIKGAATARVIIGRIEPWPGGRTAVSVSIVDIPTDHGPTTFAHAPFEKAAIVASLDRLLATNVPLPSAFEQGYQTWKSANGGIFTISVSQAIAMTLGTIRPAAPPAP